MPLWPRDREACRARLQAIVDRVLPPLKALEETLRLQYEEPAKAEARVMALASVTREEMQLLRAEQMHEQSYQRAATALLKARQQSAASRAAAVQARRESGLRARRIDDVTPGVGKPPHAEGEVADPGRGTGFSGRADHAGDAEAAGQEAAGNAAPVVAEGPGPDEPAGDPETATRRPGDFRHLAERA
jgi:hypothetical protein